MFITLHRSGAASAPHSSHTRLHGRHADWAPPESSSHPWAPSKPQRMECVIAPSRRMGSYLMLRGAHGIWRCIREQFECHYRWTSPHYRSGKATVEHGTSASPLMVSEGCSHQVLFPVVSQPRLATFSGLLIFEP